MIGLIKPSELDRAHRWLTENFLLPAAGDGDCAGFPGTFHYGEHASVALPADSTARRRPARAEDGFTRETICVTDLRTGLASQCEIKTFTRFPAVEWVVYFQNTGEADTPILADTQPLDVQLTVDAQTPCRVRHARGPLTQTDNFAPLETPLTFRQGGSRAELAARLRKSSIRCLLCFNLEMGSGDVIGAVAWSGL